MSYKVVDWMGAARALWAKRFGIFPATPSDYGIDNNTPLKWRNAANTADVAVVNYNGSNVVELGAASSTVSFLGSTFKLINTGWLKWRNAADNADINVMQVDANNTIIVGNSSNNVYNKGAFTTQTVAAPTQETTAGAVTLSTGQLLGGVYYRDPNGASRADVTPTAAQIVAAIPGAYVGQSFELTILNNANAAETITLTGGTNVTVQGQSAHAVVAQDTSATFLFILTNVTASSEAVSVYRK